jgi:FtsP/CotA-like multicopper oxidase with cupredoxin domain
MDNRYDRFTLNRRDLLRLGGGLLAATAAGARSASAGAFGQQTMDGLFPCTVGGPLYMEVYPTSPFILEPFSQELPNPAPARPSNPALWTDIDCFNWQRPDCRTGGQQDYDEGIPERPAKHQVGYDKIPVGRKTIAYPEPLYYRLALQVGQHQFSNSRVLPIQSNGRPVDGTMPGFGQMSLPASTIYGFSTTPNIPNSSAFPGAMIYARYGQPVCLRLENQLHLNTPGFDRSDFGSPTWGFLTHLHNGHTACESDGNPNWREDGYYPRQWCDNLYLNFPPDNDPGEKQSFLWFHDHYMHHTGANVYKGMVGLYYLYDPVLDPGDERLGLRLPGVPNPTTGRVDYDIPLAFFDVALDDGVTPHRDAHNGCGEAQPAQWGKTYFRHLPNHGFVGDIFTTNCVAYPVLHVKRRKYRLRLLGASIARIYEFSFQTDGDVVPAGLDAAGEAAYHADPANFDFNAANWDTNPKRRQGQWRYRNGQQCLNFHEIATDGGLLPYSLLRNSVEIWPAKRRELIVDFSKTIDGQPTYGGQEIYLVNTYQMTNGRKRTEQLKVLVDENGNEIQPLQLVPNPDFEPGFCVPMMKIVIDPDPVVDNSQVPVSLRPLPVINTKRLKDLQQRSFTLHRGGTFGSEVEWLINGNQFHYGHNIAFPRLGQPEVWTVRNGGGGWVHPMHMHYEEHRVISRNGIPTPLDPRHPDDNSREDVVALEPGEEVVIYRNFRTFAGPYVAHCHNLAHEDHNMMFGFHVLRPGETEPLPPA